MESEAKYLVQSSFNFHISTFPLILHLLLKQSLLWETTDGSVVEDYERFLMKTRSLSLLVALFALAGMALSGYLTWNVYWGPGCSKTFITCSGTSGPVEIFGLPTCIYGFAMFTILFVLALISAARTTKGVRTAIFWLSIFGVLFSASLSVYELWILKISVSGLPACVYGFFLYVAMFITVLYLKPTTGGVSSSAPVPPLQGV